MALKDILTSLLGTNNGFAVVTNPDEAIDMDVIVDEDLTPEMLEELSNGKGDDE